MFVISPFGLSTNTYRCPRRFQASPYKLQRSAFVANDRHHRQRFPAPDCVPGGQLCQHCQCSALLELPELYKGMVL